MAEILFVNDNRDLTIVTVKLLADAGYSVAAASRAEEALGLLRENHFELVISDLHMPEIDGIRLARIIRAGVYPTSSQVPIILLSATVNESLSADLLKESGINEFIHLPCEPDHLLARVAEHMGRETDSPMGARGNPEQRTILLVDDEPDFVALMVQTLDGLGYRLLTAYNGADALGILRRERVSLMMLDYMLPDTNGIVVLREARQIQPETLVVMLTGHGSQEVAVEALWAGAADYLEKPVKNKVLRATIAEVLLRGHTLQMASYLKDQIRLLRDQGEKIERLKRLNEAIVGSIPDPICVLDHEQTIITANPSFWTAFDLIPDPGQPRKLSGVLAFSWLAKAVDETIREGRPAYGMEFEHGSGNGSMRTYRCRLMPLLGTRAYDDRDPSGHALLLLQDVTEQRRAARMEEALRSEQEQTRMMSTFVQMLSGAAHELNNPLAVVMGLSDLGRQPDPNPNAKQIADMFNRIFEQSRRCQKIVKDLTAFLATERTLLRPGSIYDVLEAALSSKRPKLDERQVRVNMPARLPLPKAAMNEQQIQQVFEQVIENACQAFADAGRGGAIRITLGLEPAEPRDLVSVDIANDGPPIPDEFLQRIFLPFVTGRGYGVSQGLGLAVCYGILRNHGGKIRARNLPEGGCAFTVWLPVAGQAALTA